MIEVIRKGYLVKYVPQSKSKNNNLSQGAVLGLVMFLLYINDISENISSSLQLFANDCIMYKIIKSTEDYYQLQHDLDLASKWSRMWQMHYNVNKCVTLRCHRILSPSILILHTV